MRDVYVHSGSTLHYLRTDSLPTLVQLMALTSSEPAAASGMDREHVRKFSCSTSVFGDVSTYKDAWTVQYTPSLYQLQVNDLVMMLRYALSAAYDLTNKMSSIDPR